MSVKNALHINSYFLDNKIHYNLRNAILKYRPDIFLIPVYKSFKAEKHIEGLEVDYIFTKTDKIFFFTKALKVIRLAYKKKLTQGYTYIHAHTLISDGIPAYLLSRITKKKLVITVRSADVDVYIKKSRIFRSIANKILTTADMVFFVSPAYKEKIINLFPQIDKKKYFPLPNGIDDFWLNNKHKKDKETQNLNTVNILFVGQIIKRKKLDLLIDFIKKYNDRKYVLNIVGKNLLNLEFNKISQSVTNGNVINYIGEVRDRNQLLDIYKNNDVFVLLSYRETFGVVYIEALSQGLPIIYTRGDGVDGYFKDGEVGYSCSHESMEELKEKLDLVVANYSSLIENTTRVSQNFEWDYLIKNYITNINNNL
ncbi:glycosyltransferase [Adhaeribacter pallidiroseus]|uniref:N-acetyl-alpha-D-glucosaminyl L-malate synthase n=1 Tax=Adhaeribacter pallidiroseus TaxID=2072847 RepID=A0A369QNW3_9BACT|nr:glycosyltransferase [Adhaeribacter pallidiroseus]RDC66032.1 N-acetyl-alpha-D-glucosaminyl L-malate synthase [Adhaeribacter pallidiroseus]